ncbi:hypothetical protein [Arabiibacter massiliensis]|uniref:hypothetical protein n=1 Tax=Arabiibacter massiliensis TaxID=1870985 RepID=UPI0009BC1E79|nr:hypothetical protein [Arabiibacter massiliensis]
METLEYVRMAPLFDSGNSLWCRTSSLSSPIDYEYRAKPFFYGTNPARSARRQLECCEDIGWLDSAALDGFAEEATDILALNENLTEKRILAIRKGLERTVRGVVAFAEQRSAG